MYNMLIDKKKKYIEQPWWARLYLKTRDIVRRVVFYLPNKRQYDKLLSKARRRDYEN